MTVGGIHHITCIAGDAQENLDFYAGVLGMRLVKRSVNQDVPDTYHLFYADAEGHPGTDLTFFPWPRMAPAREGHGVAVEVALAVPPGSLTFWSDRLTRAGASPGTPEERFGEQVLPLRDPHGLPLALVETGAVREFAPWGGSPIPAERQIRGLHAVRLWERELERSRSFLTDILGFETSGSDGGWHRHAVAGGGSGTFVDIRERPDVPRGAWGVGGIHHVAWRVPDIAAQRAMQERVREAGRRPTDLIDRFWFSSIYFLEPGGVLFEIATDGPGFGVDEDMAALGETLVLPPWLESQRGEIERELPSLRIPTGEIVLEPTSRQ